MTGLMMVKGWLGILAQAAAATGAGTEAEAGTLDAQHMVLTDMIFNQGGVTMYVLLALLALAIFMAVYFLLTLRMNLLLSADFAREAEEIAGRGDAEALSQACKRDGSVGASIVGAAAHLLYDNPRAEYLAVRDAIEGEGSRQSNALWQRIQYMMDVAVIAPMIGLLGTVLGMIQTFFGLETSLTSGNPKLMAAGISKALITTAGGLVIGIAAMMVYAYFRGRVHRLISQLEERCGAIIQRFMNATHDQRTGPPTYTAPTPGQGPRLAGKSEVSSTITLTPRGDGGGSSDGKGGGGPLQSPPKGVVLKD